MCCHGAHGHRVTTFDLDLVLHFTFRSLNLTMFSHLFGRQVRTVGLLDFEKKNSSEILTLCEIARATSHSE